MDTQDVDKLIDDLEKMLRTTLLAITLTPAEVGN